MQDNRNTPNENPPLDAEDWEIVLEPYVNHPLLALALAQHLSALQDYVESEPGKATAAINRAVDSLFEHSEFRSVGLELFRARVQGRMSVEVENLLNQLGIRS